MATVSILMMLAGFLQDFSTDLSTQIVPANSVATSINLPSLLYFGDNA